MCQRCTAPRVELWHKIPCLHHNYSCTASLPILVFQWKQNKISKVSRFKRHDLAYQYIFTVRFLLLKKVKVDVFLDSKLFKIVALTSVGFSSGGKQVSKARSKVLLLGSADYSTHHQSNLSVDLIPIPGRKPCFAYSFELQVCGMHNAGSRH